MTIFKTTAPGALAALALALSACADYTRTSPATSDALPPEVTADCPLIRGHESSIVAGRTVYDGSCIRCHGADGKGVSGSVPPLAGSVRLAEQPLLAVNAIIANQFSNLPVHGMQYNDLVATLGSLTDTEVADVLTYVMTAWGNCNATIEREQVTARRPGGA